MNARFRSRAVPSTDHASDRSSALTAARLAFLGVLLVCACTSAPPPAPRSSLTVGLVGEPSSLFAGDRSTAFLASLVTEELVRVDDKGELTARLVETVPTLENGLARIAADESAPAGRLQVTFVLRNGVVWQDGTPITSDDIRFAWERDRGAPVGTPARADADLIERIDLVTTRAAVVVFNAGVRTSAYATIARVLPRHVLDGASAEDVASYMRRPMHAGPFSIASWQEGAGATLVRFDRYVLGKPSLSRIDVRFYADADALVAALRGGAVQLAPEGILTADLGPSLERFAESKSLVIRYTPQVWGDFILFNFRTTYGDVRVRRAVAMAVDRRAINQQVFGGRARIPTSYLLAPSWAAADSGPPPEVDLAGAVASLRSAGYCIGVCVSTAQLRARIVVEGSSPPRVTAATLVAHDLRRLGLAASVGVYDERGFAEVTASGDFDIAIAARGGTDPADATAEYTSASARDLTAYADPVFDALARSASAYLTRAERRPLYLELQRIWTQALPALPLYQELALDVVPSGLDGVAPSPRHGPLSWNASAWRFLGP